MRAPALLLTLLVGVSAGIAITPPTASRPAPSAPRVVDIRASFPAMCELDDDPVGCLVFLALQEAAR